MSCQLHRGTIKINEIKDMTVTFNYKNTVSELFHTLKRVLWTPVVTFFINVLSILVLLHILESDQLILIQNTV